MIEFILRQLHAEFRDASFDHAGASDDAVDEDDSMLEAGLSTAFAMAARRCRMLSLALATAEWLETP